MVGSKQRLFPLLFSDISSHSNQSFTLSFRFALTSRTQSTTKWKPRSFFSNATWLWYQSQVREVFLLGNLFGMHNEKRHDVAPVGGRKYAEGSRDPGLICERWVSNGRIGKMRSCFEWLKSSNKIMAIWAHSRGSNTLLEGAYSHILQLPLFFFLMYLISILKIYQV